MMSPVLIFLLLVFLLPTASAAQAGETCSTLPGPPGRNGRNGRNGRDGAPGRDGMPGTPGTCSFNDIQSIKEELQQELEQSLMLRIHERFQNLTSQICNHSCKNDTYNPVAPNCPQSQSCSNGTTAPVFPACSQDLGETSNPAESCEQIYNCQLGLPSAPYWITPGGENTIRPVYCDLEEHVSGTREWARVAYINMTEDGAQCPSQLAKLNEKGKTICTQRPSSSPMCTSVRFTAEGRNYSKIRGMAVGYQKGTIDAFQGHSNINSWYVDGISLTYGSPRKHIWTYAIGASDNYDHRVKINCPCAKYPGHPPPRYIGDHYYCESGNTFSNEHLHFYSDDPLWDGQGCRHGNSCCSRPGMPWFHRTLPEEVNDDIEMRLCRSEGSSDERVYLEVLQLYIQ